MVLHENGRNEDSRIEVIPFGELKTVELRTFEKSGQSLTPALTFLKIVLTNIMSIQFEQGLKTFQVLNYTLK